MTKTEALKNLYAALGGAPEEVEDKDTIAEVLAEISKLLGAETDYDTIAELVDQIADAARNKNVVSFARVGTMTLLNSIRGLNIKVPTGVTAIGEGAFTGCTGLESITIPHGVTSIAEDAFSGCTALETISIDQSEGSITGSPWGAPETCEIIWTGEPAVEQEGEQE